MPRFPKMWVILDVITFILWKFLGGAANKVKGVASALNVKVFGVNLLAPLQAIMKGLCAAFAGIALILKLVFFLCLIITIILLVRMIIAKIKFKKQMQKVDAVAAQSPVVQAPVATGVEVQSDGTRAINSFK